MCLEDLDSRHSQRASTGTWPWLAWRRRVFSSDTTPSNIGLGAGFHSVPPVELSGRAYLVAGASLGAGGGGRLSAGPLTDPLRAAKTPAHHRRPPSMPSGALPVGVHRECLHAAGVAHGSIGPRDPGPTSAIATAYKSRSSRPRGPAEGQLSIIPAVDDHRGKSWCPISVAVVILLALPDNAGNLDWRPSFWASARSRR